ncbi:MAG: ABC-type transport auxiliary lipoprotein family protein [Planctomycetota bacterium]|jgi:ABC-type uncharacterized transport system auxiliary subunit
MKASILLSCLALTSAIMGCVDVSSLNREAAEQRRYVLDSRREAKLPAAGSQQLQVENFHVSSAYSGRSFVYRTEASAVESDFYNEFHLAPGEAVSQVLRTWLADSGLFRSVRASGSRLAPDLILEGDITELYGDYRSDPAEAVCTIQFILIDASNNELLFQETMSSSIAVNGDSVSDLVAAWNRCLAEISAALEDRLRARG